MKNNVMLQLNKVEMFRILIGHAIERRGGTEEDKRVANAWTLGLAEEAVPASVNRAADDVAAMVIRNGTGRPPHVSVLPARLRRHPCRIQQRMLEAN